MKVKALFLVVSFVFFLVGCQAGSAGVINAVCPVMGGKVDKNTSYTVEYKGKKIGFCCPGCSDTFKADPEKYMTKL